MDLKNVPVTGLKGIGEKSAKTLKKLSVETLDNLLWYLPRTYIRYPEPVPVMEVKDGDLVAVEVIVDGNFRETNNRMLVSTFTAHDRTGVLEFIFFMR